VLLEVEVEDCVEAPPPILSLPMLLVIPAAAAAVDVLDAAVAVDVRDAAVAVVVASLSEGARERGMLDEED
jgi:hypothetical protein